VFGGGREGVEFDGRSCYRIIMIPSWWHLVVPVNNIELRVLACFAVEDSSRWVVIGFVSPAGSPRPHELVFTLAALDTSRGR
jgi:hypothetical protein